MSPDESHDIRNVIQTLARVTGKLSPSGGQPVDSVKRLRKDLTSVIVSNNFSFNDLLTTYRFDTREDILPGRDEITRYIGEVKTGASEDAGKLRVVQRAAVHFADHPRSGWAKGQLAAYTMGPFEDEYGRQSWFDFFKPVSLQSVNFKPEGLPFLKFDLVDHFQAGNIRRLNLKPGSIWIRADYFTPEAPANAFIGLKIKSGILTFKETPEVSGGNIRLEPGGSCHLKLQLIVPGPAHPAGNTSGNDAIKTVCRVPDKVSFNFKIRSGSVESISNPGLRIYGNEFNLVHDNQSWQYNQKMERIELPLGSDVEAFRISDSESGFFLARGTASVEQVAWSLPVSMDDHTRLGAASGNSGYVVKAGRGIKATLADGNSFSINEASWLLEQGKIELHAWNANADTLSRRFRLWHEDTREVKWSSVTIDFSKQLYLKYSCLGPEETELIQTSVTLHGHLDRPVKTDGKRISIDFDECDYVQGQTGQSDFVYCISLKNIMRKAEQKKRDSLAPVSMALSNAFVKLSPCDDFILYGSILEDDLIKAGVCSLSFGLYSLIPVFPDPYVSNIGLTGTQREESTWFKTDFQNYFQAFINWTDVYAPELTFQLKNEGSPLFGKIPAERKSPYQKLHEANSRNPITTIIVPDEPHKKPVERKVSDIIREDEQREQALGSYFQEYTGGSFIPDHFVLDVSGNLDQFGIGLSGRDLEANGYGRLFKFAGLDLLIEENNIRIITLPPVQWEPVETDPNPKVQPANFPSPAYALDTGDPAVIVPIPSFELIAVTPEAAIRKLAESFADPRSVGDQKAAALFNLPFGMKSFLRLEQHFSDHFLTRGVTISNNQPYFADHELTGGNQLSFAAFFSENDAGESSGFGGATLQTRNLVNKNGDVVGLSVLGPFADTIFNNELNAGGYHPRVPLRRIDISGYGASIFSHWRNPEAPVGTTSQARFDVLVGRTSHEIVQVKSLLYGCCAGVVRTITIQRTSGGGIMRHDSGWEAEGPGIFTYSYKELEKDSAGEIIYDTSGKPLSVPKTAPYTFHKGLVSGYYNITGIRDTSRIIKIPALGQGVEEAELQEVMYDADIQIKDVIKGQVNGLVPCKGQRGFVQLKPAGKPISNKQLQYLLEQEGPLGGPVDCVIDIGRSGQLMRVVRADTTVRFGTGEFVNALRGTLLLPEQGNWGVVQSKGEDVSMVDDNSGLSLIIYSQTPDLYEFAEPAKGPDYKYGLMHSGGAHRALFLKPSIIRGQDIIFSEQPCLADIYSLSVSTGFFPKIPEVFTMGGGSGQLKVIANGKLELVSSGKLNIFPVSRELSADSGSRTYVEYSDNDGTVCTGIFAIDPSQPAEWSLSLSTHKLLFDTGDLSRIMIYSVSHQASSIEPPNLNNIKLALGSAMSDASDIMRFMDDFAIENKFVLSSANNLFGKNFSYKFIQSLEVKTKFQVIKEPLWLYSEIHVYTGKKKLFPIIKGNPPTTPPWFKGEIKVKAKIYSGEYPAKRKPKSGLEMTYAGRIAVKSFSLTDAVDSVYSVGSTECVIAKDKLSFQVCWGGEVELRITYLKLELSRLIGIQGVKEKNPTKYAAYALIVQTGTLSLAEYFFSVGVRIEGKAGIAVKIEGDAKTTYALFFLTLAVEISIAWVMNTELEWSWEEEITIS
jgi:hypothetical protein